MTAAAAGRGVGGAKPGQPERAVARACIAWMRMVLPPGSVPATIPNEQRGTGQTAMQRARYGRARKASGVVTGMPDCVVALPSGRTIWIEFKAPGTGVLSDAQDGLHTRFRSLGHVVIVADGIECLRHGLQAAGVPLREAAGQAAAPAKVRVAKPRVPRLVDDPLPW